ncbi:hypothetical protein [Pararhodobacter oceanensis]|uniref:Uncharacterized protein n=1 Tax=Pararhodobacter oceanensis TaxID=2172121 RepID=A0A2T8HQU0_9RHOB|nr:hypothetical protein [Pararhodobacter oceanensis]PVH27652.1 hypothetical protein DDE20_16195 [Pararhodobacter oceanensis]
MTRLPTLFYATAAICALIGMAWGIQMSASHNHLLAPAHGHLNLIGFVAMAIFGTYYALSPQAAETRLAGAHYALSLAAVVLLVPGIALAITERTEVLAQIGSLVALLAMLLFAYIVLRHGVGAASSPRATTPRATPAE